MDKIPTAEEFFKTHSNEIGQLTPEGIVYRKMIEFAQLHVEAALKAAQEHVEESMEGSTHMSAKITSAYPLNLIE